MFRIAAVCLFASVMTSTALAHSNDPHENARSPKSRKVVETEFGMSGRPDAVNTTIKVEMNDEMLFKPGVLHIQSGATIRFVITNRGDDLHEMVLGRTEDLKKHAKLMARFPGMEHDEPYMTHVKAGQAGEIIWTFSKAGQFEYGCLIPGHYESGMKGTVYVQASAATNGSNFSEETGHETPASLR